MNALQLKNNQVESLLQIGLLRSKSRAKQIQKTEILRTTQIIDEVISGMFYVIPGVTF